MDTNAMAQNVVLSKIPVSRLCDFKVITKMGLSLSVVFSCIAGYLLAAETINISKLIFLSIGGYCMVGASNVFNQIIERDLDALMERTKDRPIPKGRISVKNAFMLATILTIIGLIILYAINPSTAMFAAISIFLYTCVYTPLKQKTALSVLAGAIPGAIPFMLGWVACTGHLGLEAGVLFMMQFFWQFPHFWSIAWLLDKDYKKAGFKMLPTGAKDRGTVLQIIAYICWTILICLAPLSNLTGGLKLSIYAAIPIIIVGFVFLYYGFKLFKNKSENAAKKLMAVSIIYLMSMQIIYVIDKFI